MRLSLLIRDAEYRDALANKLSLYDNDIFVNINNGTAHDSSDSLILTDIAPSSIDPSVMVSLKQRLVFLTVSVDSIPAGYNRIFKYSSISSMISGFSPGQRTASARQPISFSR